jgi:hypothetical protein
VLAGRGHAALVEHLDELGFDGYSRPGTAPAGGGGSAFAKAIEVEEEGEARLVALQPTAGETELKSFNTAVRDFLEPLQHDRRAGRASTTRWAASTSTSRRRAKGGH